jgi:hypothetical protein
LSSGAGCAFSCNNLNAAMPSTPPNTHETIRRTAHQVNASLTVIGGHIALLQTALPDDGPERARMNVMTQALTDASSAIGDLLAITGSPDDQLELLDINAVIRDTHDSLQRVVGVETDVILRLDPATPRVRADAIHVEHVILSLAALARHAMPWRGTLDIDSRLATLTPRRAAVHGVAPGEYVQLTFQMAETGAVPAVADRRAIAAASDVARAMGGFVEHSAGTLHGRIIRVYLPADGGPADVRAPGH